MSQVNFQLSENLVLNGYAVESAVVSTVPVLKFNGDILATQTFVSDAIAAISIPPAYITSVNTSNFTVDMSGNLDLASGVTLSNPTLTIQNQTTLTSANGFYGLDSFEAGYAYLQLQIHNDSALFTLFSAATAGDLFTVSGVTGDPGTDADSAYWNHTFEFVSVQSDSPRETSVFFNYTPGTAYSYNGYYIFGTEQTGAVISGGSATVSPTEISYLDGVTSNIQTQLNAKANSSDLSAYQTTSGLDSALSSLGYVTESGAENLSNKTFVGNVYFQSAVGTGSTNNYIAVDNSTGYMTVQSDLQLELTSTNDINITSNNSNIVLNADGNVYIGTASSGNEVATHGYVTGQNYITSSDQYIQSTDSNFTVSGTELTLNTTISVDQIDVSGSGDFTVTGSANIVLQPAVGDYVYVGSVSSDNKVATFGDISGLGYITSVNSPLSVTSGALSIDLSGYLTTSDASSTYLTQSDASSTYLTQSSASSTYLTSSDASSTYLTQSDASSTYATQSSLGSYLTTSDASSTYLTQSDASSTYLTQSSASSTYATPTDITNAINNLVDNAPTALDTLNKLATAINDDASYASTITLALGGKQDTLTAGNGITITGTTIALDPNVVITQVSLTDTEIGVSADSVVFGNSTTTTYAQGTTNSVYTFDSNTVTSDILINIVDNLGNSRTSKITAVHNGGQSPVWTEYAIIDSVTTSPLSVTISFAGDTFQVNVAGSGTYGIYATATNLY